MSGWIVGVDVGGTFTDIFAINPRDDLWGKTCPALACVFLFPAWRG